MALKPFFEPKEIACSVYFILERLGGQASVDEVMFLLYMNMRNSLTMYHSLHNDDDYYVEHGRVYGTNTMQMIYNNDLFDLYFPTLRFSKGNLKMVGKDPNHGDQLSVFSVRQLKTTIDFYRVQEQYPLALEFFIDNDIDFYLKDHQAIIQDQRGMVETFYRLEHGIV